MITNSNNAQTNMHTLGNVTFLKHINLAWTGREKEDSHE